jgi:hypothetical protein
MKTNRVSSFGFSVAFNTDALTLGASCVRSRATGINVDQNGTAAPASGTVHVFSFDGPHRA